jgi:MFS family permease
VATPGRAAPRAIAGGLALGAASGAAITNVAAVPDALAAAYGVSLATVGLFTTALLIPHTGAQLPGGRAVDRFGARRLGLFALALVTICNAVALLAPEPALVVGARAVSGLGTGVGFIAGSDYVRTSSSSAVAQGMFGGIAMGGAGVALAIVPQLEPLIGWRAPFLFAVVTSLLAAFLLALAPRDGARPRAAGRRGLIGLDLVAERRLYRLSVLHIATFGFGLLLGNWVVALLVRLGHGQAASGAIGALTLVVTMGTRPLGGWLLHRRPGRMRLAVALSLVAGALGCTGLAVAGGSTPVAIVCAVAIGIGAGISFAPVFTAAAKTRPDAPGAAVGVVNMWGNLAVLAATPLLGLAFSLPGDGRIGFLVIASLWAAAVLIVPSARQLGLEPAAPAVRAADRTGIRSVP